MARLYGDVDKYGSEAPAPVTAAFHGAVQDLVRRKLAASGLPWNDFVFGAAQTLITRADFEAIDRRLLEYGHRYTWSAIVSRHERPHAYQAVDGAGEDPANFSFKHPEAPSAPADREGRELVGCGDNVVKYDADLIGIARYVRSSAQVLAFLNEGVPPNTIAVIDDSGGTLTAPILERFAGVLCAGGTVRSHLGILTREYGIPCFMNSKLCGIRDGDRVGMECTATAKTAEMYQKGVEMTARVWRLAK